MCMHTAAGSVYRRAAPVCCGFPLQRLRIKRVKQKVLILLPLEFLAGVNMTAEGSTCRFCVALVVAKKVPRVVARQERDVVLLLLELVLASVWRDASSYHHQLHVHHHHHDHYDHLDHHCACDDELTMMSCDDELTICALSGAQIVMTK